jgi:hypothetical protein
MVLRDMVSIETVTIVGLDQRQSVLIVLPDRKSAVVHVLENSKSHLFLRLSHHATMRERV